MSSYTLKETSAFCPSFRSCRDGDVSVHLLIGASFLQAVLKTVNKWCASTKLPGWSGIEVPSAFEFLVFLISFSAVN